MISPSPFLQLIESDGSCHLRSLFFYEPRLRLFEGRRTVESIAFLDSLLLSQRECGLWQLLPPRSPETEMGEARGNWNGLFCGRFIDNDQHSICLCWKSQSAGLGPWALSHSPLADQWFTESIKMSGWPRAQFPKTIPAWQGRGYFSSLATSEESAFGVIGGGFLSTIY